MKQMLIQMVQHFNWFIDHDWVYLEGACYGDGIWTDGGVAVDSSSHNYLTLKDPQTDDFTMVHANNTAHTRCYEIKLQNLDTAGRPSTCGKQEDRNRGRNWITIGCSRSAW